MAPTQAASAKQRKMAAGQEAGQPGSRSALRALRLGLARAARDVFELPVAVIGATQARCAQAMLGRALGEGRMLILLDGPGGAVGVFAIDRESLASIIQQQTMGKVSGGAPAERPFTGTDAALVAPLIDGMLARAAAMTDIASDQRCLAGYRFGARTEDFRSLMLAVEAERFRVFDLTLEFAAGVQQGRVCLALPEPEPVVAPAAGPVGPRLDRAAGAARAELSAVIGHLRLSLADLAQMRPGEVLPLHHRDLDRADLVGINGERIVSVRLGQIKGMRAVRLNESVQRAGGRGAGQFHAGSLPQPESAALMTVDMPAMPAMPDLPEMPDLPDLPEIDEDGQHGVGMAAIDMTGFPSLGEEDDDLPRMSAEATALEIKELAGLPLDEEGED